MVAKTIDLGGTSLPRIGLGTNRLTDSPSNHDFIRAAVEAGVRMIDTAHLYTGGQSERAIGAALAPSRDDLVIATKGGYSVESAPPERLRVELEQSFERLQTETIGLYYLHRVHESVPVEEQLALLNEYRDAGRLRHIGLSEVGVEQIERARAVAPIAAVQNEYNLSERMWDEVVDYCAAEGIAFVSFFPLRGTRGRRVRKVAQRHAASPAQVALAWLLARSPAMLPIPGTLSLAHLRENLGALEVDLSDADRALLDR